MSAPDADRMERLATAADPNDKRKPPSLQKITKPSWVFIIRSTIRRYSQVECTNLAAGLTYKALFAVFPGIIALVSILTLFGRGDESVDMLMKDIQHVASEDTWAYA